ncbi:hypothetical protein JI735_33120 [Paenibacillus sonchi]|uniref:Uncharacterized protein n=1 Tax=Paenibacillus sonchi TaxID=373687 RepID=A0A974PIG8_9BACL|nr:hypothetical protein [Paenibacillus sonchi]QQZ64456.1 hypothetical protein JI735_33120 [Paenibacillus sonchi]
MNLRSGKGKRRAIGSSKRFAVSNNNLNSSVKYSGIQKTSSEVIISQSKGVIRKRISGGANRMKVSASSGAWTIHKPSEGVFIGPSVVGVDKKYVRVISGDIDDRLPSFAK